MLGDEFQSGLRPDQLQLTSSYARLKVAGIAYKIHMGLLAASLSGGFLHCYPQSWPLLEEALLEVCTTRKGIYSIRAKTSICFRPSLKFV